jgi:hypothetical protein
MYIIFYITLIVKAEFLLIHVYCLFDDSFGSLDD